MIFSFTVRGFQSVKKKVRVVVDGYCVIEGESNLGKTAVIRAIVAALSNRTGTEFITDGEASCEVIIGSAGHELTWEKTPKSTTYRMDGQEISKAGRGVIPDEVKLLGISAIRTLDKQDHWPQIHLQWEQPFLIGAYTDTIAAELLGASAETSKITRAIKLVNTDVSRYKTKAELLEIQHKDISGTVQVMEEIATRINASQQVVDQHELARNEIARKENTYKSLVHQYRTSWGRWKIANPLSKLVIPSPPDCTGYEALRDIHQRYSRALTLVKLASRNLDSVPAIPDGRQRVADLIRLHQEGIRVSRRVALLRSVVKLPPVSRPDWQATADRVRALGELQSQFLKTHRDLESSTRVLSEINQGLKGIEEEKKKLDYVVSNMEVCPLCSAPMRGGKFCIEEANHV